MEMVERNQRDAVHADVIDINSPSHRRVSWGAIFGGVVVAVAIQIMLGVLGLGIGLMQFDPATNSDPLQGFGTGAAVWSVLSILIALFAGGWIAGRLSGVPRKTAGTLHGLVVWGLATVLMLQLATSAVGSVVGGAMSVLGSAARVAAEGIGAAAPAVGGQIASRTDGANVQWSDIRAEAMEMLRQTGDPALQPDSLRAQASAAGREADQRAMAAGRPDADAEAQLGSALDRLFNRASDVASEVDKQDVANVLAARTDMTQQEARRRVDEWDQRYQGLRQAVSSQAGSAGERASEISEGASDAVGQAAIWTFFGLLVAAIAAAVGGGIGAPALIETRRAEIPVR